MSDVGWAVILAGALWMAAAAIALLATRSAREAGMPGTGVARGMSAPIGWVRGVVAGTDGRVRT